MFVTGNKQIWAKENQKGLDSRPHLSIVAPPSSNVPRTMGGTKEATTSTTTVPSQQISVFDGKVLTDRRLVVLVDIFPSEGRVL